MTTDRWRDGRLGLVHQLAPREEKIVVSEAPYYGGSISSYYGPKKERVVVRWEPLCGIRRKLNKRRGRHSGPLTCLLCIGRL